MKKLLALLAVLATAPAFAQTFTTTVTAPNVTATGVIRGGTNTTPNNTSLAADFKGAVSVVGVLTTSGNVSIVGGHKLTATGSTELGAPGNATTLVVNGKSTTINTVTTDINSNTLNTRSIKASGNINATGFVTGQTVTASGAINGDLGTVRLGAFDQPNGLDGAGNRIANGNDLKKLKTAQEAGDATNAAAIASEATTRADADAALSARIDANANAATAQIAASEARSIKASRQSGALAMAVAGMTGAAPTGKGATAISMGVGTFGGETALAVGVSHAVNDAVRIFGSVTKVSGGDTGAALGGSFSF